MEQEEWRDIPKLPGYQASSFGRIKGPDGQVRKLQGHKSGYPTLHVMFSAHVLVCEAFHGPKPSPEMQSLHGPDFTKTNIRPDNLRWGTHTENVEDTKNSGNHNLATPKGEEHGRALLTWELVKKARTQASLGTPIKALWRELGVPIGIEYAAFYKAVKGITWKEEP